MIPLKIQIKNFLSYGPELQEIDFTRYQMICLSGKNGHGKSALLDAITWAVWGQARKSSGQPKPDHGLLHLGQRNMKIVFDFEFNNLRYRVRREFTFAYGKPSAYLEFGMFAEGSDDLITLTDKTIRKTQAKIELLLGLDFNSFINSAFIRQGNAGEFSNKSAKERKDILGSILGLGVYDKLRKLAADKSRLLENDRHGLLKLQERLLLEIGQQSEIETMAQNLRDKLILIQKKQEHHETLLNEYHKQQQALIWLRELKTTNHKKLNELTLSYQEGLLRLRNLRSDWQQLLIKIRGVLNRHDLELKQAELTQKMTDLRFKQKINWETKELLAQVNVKYQKIETSLFNDNDQKINQLVLNLEKQQLNFKHVDDLRQKDAQELEVLQQSQMADNIRLQNYAKLKNDHQQLQKQFERYKEFYQRLIVMGNAAKYTKDEISHKQVYLEQDCPSCPLCEQNLSAARKRLLATQFTTQIRLAQHRVNRVTHLLKNLKIKICEQHQQLEQQNKELQNCNVLQAQATQNQSRILILQKNLAQSSKQLTDIKFAIDQNQKDLQQYRQDRLFLLQNNSEASELQNLIKSYEQLLQENYYDENEFLAYDQKLSQIAKLLMIDSSDQLMKDRAHILAQVSLLIQELKTKKTIMRELDKQIQQSANLDHDLNNLEKLLAKLSQDFTDCKSERELVLQELGRVQEQLDQMNKTKLELDHLKKEINSLENSVQDYKSLANTFGKDGLQALLIEDAIPEIEQEANYLLGRLTDNQAQLFIESLRDLKSGGTKETLDIKISDSVGLRPYEMFSGGEAFRIDFALRIAISKLLARRAGTALQTLIIDEGFGSQDEDGLAHIMDALYKIQDDFAKIIIVSHLNTMKEQFPVHFCIQKTATGSIVSVMEQG